MHNTYPIDWDTRDMYNQSALTTYEIGERLKTNIYNGLYLVEFGEPPKETKWALYQISKSC
jgi:hypothetical protein